MRRICSFVPAATFTGAAQSRPGRRGAEPRAAREPSRGRPAVTAAGCDSFNAARELVAAELMMGAPAMSSPPGAPCATPTGRPQTARIASPPGSSPRVMPAQRRFPATTHSLWPVGPVAEVAVAMSGRIEARRLYEITIPGLAIDTEFIDLRRSVLAAFPRVVEVFAMDAPETVLVAYRGEDEIDAWCETLSRAPYDKMSWQSEGSGVKASSGA